MSNRIVPCCARVFEDEENVKKYFIRTDSNSSVNILTEYLDLREKYISLFQKGIIPDFCVDCLDYKPIDINNYTTFSSISINNNTSCHCKCVYCCLAGEDNTQEDFDRINNEKNYDIIPILNEIMDRNLINNFTTIYLLGGEPTEYPQEVEYILDFVKKNNLRLVFFTNAMIFSQSLANALEELNIDVFISIDSGSKQVYEKIKRVKAFDRVIDNIKKYSYHLKKNPNSYIRLKYLICPPINDNVDELKKFFSLSLSLGITNLSLSIDRFWMAKNKNKPVPPKIKECISYFCNQTDYTNLKTSIEYSMLPESYVKKALNNSLMDRLVAFLFKFFK